MQNFTCKALAVFMCLLGILAGSTVFAVVAKASLALGYNITVLSLAYAGIMALFCVGIYQTVTE